VGGVGLVNHAQGVRPNAGRKVYGARLGNAHGNGLRVAQEAALA
jgi:hypothetical protein